MISITMRRQEDYLLWLSFYDVKPILHHDQAPSRQTSRREGPFFLLFSKTNRGARGIVKLKGRVGGKKPFQRKRQETERRGTEVEELGAVLSTHCGLGKGNKQRRALATARLHCKRKLIHEQKKKCWKVGRLKGGTRRLTTHGRKSRK